VLSHSGGLSMEEAFIMLRTYARNNNLTLRVVSESVTNHTLDLTANPATPSRQKLTR
jgi:hypothetical protein